MNKVNVLSHKLRRAVPHKYLLRIQVDVQFLNESLDFEKLILCISKNMFMTQNSDTGLKKYFNINIDWCFYFNTWSLLMFNINTTKKKTIL